MSEWVDTIEAAVVMTAAAFAVVAAWVIYMAVSEWKASHYVRRWKKRKRRA